MEDQLRYPSALKQPGLPLTDSYCIVPGKVYAGSLIDSEEKHKQVRQFGITHILYLTEEDKIEPYRFYLPIYCTYIHFPIRTLSVPEDCRRLENILQFIDDVANDPLGNKVYIHCRGGIGRTGTVVACLYEYLGDDFDTALARLRRNFRQCPKSLIRPIPDTPAQLSFIRTFAAYLHSHRPDKN